MKQPLIVIAGPTAVGKTSFSIELAKRVHGEIISADSMQVYRYLDIGSAKITREEMQGIPHHLINVLDPREEFHVVRFQQMAKEALSGIAARGRLPIVTGGTGFYIQALLKDVNFEDTREDSAYREELTAFAERNGAEALHQRLEALDPIAAAAIHANNQKRVIRALEYYHLTGRRISEHNEQEKQRQSPYEVLYLALTRNRAELYRRIELRVDQMMENGLLEEVKKLREMGYSRSLVSMQGLGYKELFAYLEGDLSLPEAISVIKRDTRHFAKRQLTWLKRESDVIWLDLDQHSSEEWLEWTVRLWEQRRARAEEGD